MFNTQDAWTYVAAVEAAAEAETVSPLSEVNLVGATEITLFLNEIQTETSSENLLLQIGPDEGVVTTGYFSHAFWSDASSVAEGAYLTGFGLMNFTLAATETMSGVYHLSRYDDTTDVWTLHGGASLDAQVAITAVGQGPALADTIGDMTLSFIGGDGFDGGDVRIRYR
jgi:hypothetical protein